MIYSLIYNLLNDKTKIFYINGKSTLYGINQKMCLLNDVNNNTLNIKNKSKKKTIYIKKTLYYK